MPTTGSVRQDPLTHLRARVTEQSDGCWIWQQHCNRQGYGTVRLMALNERRAVLVHRAMYELLIGPIPDGMELDHLCRVRACCNPAHLEAVTHKVNIERGEWQARKVEARRAKTHCQRDHEYTPANTYLDSHGRRHCRACKASWARAARAAS